MAKPPVLLPQTPEGKRAMQRAAFLYVAHKLREDGLGDLADFVLERAPSERVLIAPASDSFDDVLRAPVGALL
jgi:hypothetical protein